ncbi:hypothetical protein VOLCADRAFT_82194 [Volvox carteri f. nagariensis]|uniref:Pyrimidine 5-nucleotidase n=1 Tax=Volvox carteri f. nagariensis TaxID=3068 RepID=D8U498_VOLCA|nr:uncharacterized protein VOLCADRAFT_82194 [Volvox carteri f. nagariensis]EFJ45366.1 hypothetical protein VOLCADRAFT_82194 [Volvox carteri f. nagariensis]|eukprot:XP_002953393.1 hypothetical protein VOLCADRAFT_82194 [Volvox carteri f. nagariensis]
MTVGNAPGPLAKGRPAPRVLLVDLDDTLYRVHQIPAIVKQRIQEYMVKKLGIPQDEVAAKTTELYLAYGTTLAGLVATGYRIDYDDWHEFVHQGALDYDTLLQPDPSLRDILCSIDLPKYILTNANRVHTERALARMGLSDCFQGMFYFENVMELAASHGFDVAHGVLCKPNPRIYQLVAEQLGVGLSEIIFFDDSTRNVASAHGLGCMTVLVGSDKPCPGADLSLPTMHDLPAAMPELLDQPGLVHEHHSSIPGMAQEQHAALAVPTAVGGAAAGSCNGSGIAVSVPAS